MDSGRFAESQRAGGASNADYAVQGTSNDAAVSRESAARLGYIADPFIRHFVKPAQRRAPLINRGTYCRFHGVQNTLCQFVQALAATSTTSGGQIVVLGAGFDTSYFILEKEGLSIGKFFEIDFAEITAKKAATIYRHPDLKALLPQDTKVALGGSELHSSRYSLISGDLREFKTHVVPKLVERGFDPNEPTLFLSECVLIYLDPQHSDQIIDWVTQSVPNAAILTYEQIRPDDRFGQMMIDNLRARQIELRGLHAHPTLESTSQRFLSRGWHSAMAVDLADYHDRCVDESERARLAKLEFLDEWEEFTLLAQHYAFTFAYSKDAEPFQMLAPLQ
ncbi:carboxy methyl transferase for protein phosphatase 2A [Coemansia sp. RSA 2424]|nr:carboxy methyl transferase for protein phosphatase 2A [Coemansia sp. RSA 2424]